MIIFTYLKCYAKVTATWLTSSYEFIVSLEESTMYVGN